ncbi:hypothetical protein F5880DRAFT_1512374 [Lentinula raphanica]|nr:hypothetical protein F5880DRAFT_1512374 [Lentinula raphanica]
MGETHSNVVIPGTSKFNTATATVRRSALATDPARDIIIIIKADRLDLPRAFIKMHPSPNHPTAAIGLSLVPQLKMVTPCSEMEYIILVDRSGSMKGVKMKMARQAVILLLSQQLYAGTYYNLISFGKKADRLWTHSQEYSKDNHKKFTQYLHSMEANYGGTDIPHALDATFKSLPSKLTRPVSIFLLTDGAVWGALLHDCVTKVEKAIADRSSDKAFMRVFTIGIGNANAARRPPIVDLKVDWVTAKDNSQRHYAPGQVLSLYAPDAEEDDYKVGSLASSTRQAPRKITSFYHTKRSEVFAIVPSNIAASKELKVSGHIPFSDNPIEYTVSLEHFVGLPNEPFLHTLAAKALILDCEYSEDRPPIGTTAKELQTEITRLGLDYQLISRYTSLLAVEKQSQHPHQENGLRIIIDRLSKISDNY